MKRKFTLLIAALALLTMIVQPGRAWGQTKDDVEVSWTASEQGYTNAQDVGDITIDDHISGTFAKNSGTNGPKYYTSGESVRMYNLNSLTITPDENSTITAIIFTLSQSGGFSVSTGEYSVTGSTGTWSGSSTGSIVFTNGSAQNRIQVISVTYTYSGTPAVTHTLTYSANPTEGGTVTVGSTTLAEGATTSISATANAGYVFSSWTVTGEGSSVNEAGDTFTMGTENATLTANFTAVTTYTVTYVANGPEADDIEDTYNEGATVTLRPANTFTYAGHAFTEWNTDANGDGDAYDAGDVINSIDDDLELYAIWTENPTPTPGGDTETTYTFSTKSWGADPQDWTSGKDGNQFTSGRGVQVTTGATGANATSPKSFTNVSSIVVTYSTNATKGTGAIKVQVGTNSEKSADITPVGTDDHTQAFTFETYETGSVKLTVDCTQNSIYIKSITITETSGGSTVSAPTFSIPSGTYHANQSVELSCATEGASIYYTFGDEAPTSASTPYTNAITIDRPRVLKAIAILGEENSSVATAEYVLTPESPVFTPDGGTYTSAQNVTISCVTEGTTLVYKFDGDNEWSTYVGPVTISESVTLCAKASKENWVDAEACVDYVIEQALATMDEIFAAATAAGSTATSHNITLNNWVVSGVSTNGKNVFVNDGTKGFVIFNNGADMGFTTGDVLSGTVNCKVQLYNGFAELTQLNSTTTGLSIATGGTVTAADIDMADLSGVNTGALLHYDNLTCSVDNNKYYLSDGTTTIQVYNALYAFDALENGKKYNITGVYQQYNSTKEILPRSADDIEEATVIVPTIIISDDIVDVPAEGGEGILVVSYEQFTEIVADVYFCDAQGEEATYDWITAEINDDNNVDYLVEPNEGEARTAYFKVYALDDNAEEVYSNLVTVNQAKYVVDYAELPFEYDGNGTGDLPNGFTVSGLGTYSSSPAMKFDGTGDYAILKINERPGTLSFDIKGNSFSDGTFTVQTSEDGVTYTDLETYTELGNTQSEEFDNLGENVRYIKWIYTEKVNGNVALGNINLAKYVEPVLIPSITVDPAAVSADAEEHDGTLDLTYENLTITSMDDFDIQYYDAQGEETTEPDWVEVLIAEQDPTIGEGYVVSYYMIENEGDARTAYFKVYALDGEEVVYSNLVTINQAAYVPTPTGVTYTLVTNASQIESGKHYIIVGYKNSIPYAMGLQKANNRGAIEILVNEEVATVSSNDVYEFVINGPTVVENISYYTIYDKLTPGYLYAPGNNNYLKTQTTNTDNGMWTVEFDNYVAIIKAKVENKNWMRFNTNGNNDPLFSCYGSGQTDIYLFVKDNDTDYEYYGCELTYSGDYAIPADETITIGAGSVMEVTGNLTNTTTSNLIIKDGGQLIHTGDVQATLLKDYDAAPWPSSKGVDGWYTIASPVNGANVSVVTTTANYDFYKYDEAEYKWLNQKVAAHGITTFEQGVGYLYATSEDKQGSFAGTMKATNANIEKDLSYACTVASLKGFNLMGNPFTRNLTNGDVKLGDSYLTTYYVVEGGSELVARQIDTYPIKPGQGFMVQATAENQKLVFNPGSAKGRSANNGYISIAVGNESFNDMAYINVANGNTLRKMTLNADGPKVYVMNNNLDYAAARVEGLSGSMPVCFQTKNIGTYTITIQANELDVEYLHLIDNVLHEDIDMLLEPSYSFIASGHDYAARFTLVFKANANIDEIEVNDNFAYQNGSDIIVNGNGELQVFDVTGRMVMNTKINGIQTVNVPATGMYIFRMVGESVQTQKIVVR